MSKHKVGDVVEIVSNACGHHFKIGERVEILDVAVSYIGKSTIRKDQVWYFDDGDCKAPTTLKPTSHCSIIKSHMREHGSISMLEAFGVYRIFNLKGRIADLRAAGEEIHTQMCTDNTGKKYAKYSFKEAA
jgi:hypothetical protein